MSEDGNSLKIIYKFNVIQLKHQLVLFFTELGKLMSKSDVHEEGVKNKTYSKMEKCIYIMLIRHLGISNHVVFCSYVFTDTNLSKRQKRVMYICIPRCRKNNGNSPCSKLGVFIIDIA